MSFSSSMKVQSHQVSPALFHCACILLEGACWLFDLRLELAAGMTNDLVKCRVNFACQAAVCTGAGLFYIVKGKLIGDAAASCFVVGIDDVTQAHALWSRAWCESSWHLAG